VKGCGSEFLMPETKRITVLGSFVADLTFRTKNVPAWGETILGSDFRLGPGGKGSNQAVAAARLGGEVSFLSKLGRDAFGEMARRTYQQERVDAQFVFETADYPTGAATIILDEATGENAIIVVPGASFQITPAEIDQARGLIAESAVFMTQLETRLPSVVHGLRLAHSLGVKTIFNPAPAMAVPEEIFALCDYLTPNETEAATLTGLPVKSIAEAEHAAAALLSRGARNVVITLGAQGAFVKNPQLAKLIAAVDAGSVVETTGAGDAFNAGFAIALSEGRDIISAAQFGCAVAGISVTRHGTALSMPMRAEVDAVLRAMGL
jgi:ribokinase